MTNMISSTSTPSTSPVVQRRSNRSVDDSFLLSCNTDSSTASLSPGGSMNSLANFGLSSRSSSPSRSFDLIPSLSQSTSSCSLSATSSWALPPDLVTMATPTPSQSSQSLLGSNPSSSISTVTTGKSNRTFTASASLWLLLLGIMATMVHVSHNMVAVIGVAAAGSSHQHSREEVAVTDHYNGPSGRSLRGALSDLTSSSSSSLWSSSSSMDGGDISEYLDEFEYTDSDDDDNDPSVKVWTQITFSAEYDQDLIQHSIRHYLENGNVDPSRMLITLHHYDQNATDGLMDDAIAKVTDLGVPRSSIQTWNGNFTSQKNCDMRLKHRRTAGVSDCDWVLKFDADELLRVPGNDISTFLESLGTQGFDVAYGDWVDRVAPNGTIPNMTTATPVDEQFPMGCQFSSLTDAVTFKAFAFRGYLREKRAGHRIHKTFRNMTCPYTPRLMIDHYKWSWDVFDKLKRRIEHYKTLPGVHWWTESVAFLDHIDQNDGKIDVSRPELQCEQLSGREYMPVINSNTVQSPMVDEYGNIEPNNCGNPIQQCPSKIQRRRRRRKNNNNKNPNKTGSDSVEAART
mmetsp:Transcript_50916/g.122756  ORF Transcript_50916/g.122756 Transcript_50916/m.122756 type:complete len:571 (+) Transcript_50916:167-1879(+)